MPLILASGMLSCNPAPRQRALQRDSGSAGSADQREPERLHSRRGQLQRQYDALGRLTNSQGSYTPTGSNASTLYGVRPTYDMLSNVNATTSHG